MLGVVMEYLTHVGSAGDELSACCLHIRDDEEHALSRARHGGCHEMDRARGPGRRQLHRAKVPDHEISVESPAQTPVERLCAIDVGHGDGDDLELQIDRPGIRKLHCVFIDSVGTAHCDLRNFDLRGTTSRNRWWRRLFSQRLQARSKHPVEGWEW